MKKYILLLLCIIILQTQLNAQIGISATNSPPNASAMLDVSSTTKGLLPPRMTSAQRIAIPTPADGLIVFDTDTKTLWNRQNGVWVNLLAGGVGSGPWSLSGNSVFVNNTNRVGINTANPSADLEVDGGGGLLISDPYTVTTSPPTNTITMPYNGTLATITDNAGRILDPGGNGNFVTNTNYASYITLYPTASAYGFRFTFESLDLGGATLIFSTSPDVNDYNAHILKISSRSNYAVGRPFNLNVGAIYVHNKITSGSTSATGFQLLFESLTLSSTTYLYSEIFRRGLSYSNYTGSFSVGIGSTARGDGSIAMGEYALANNSSIALGYNAYSVGGKSIAMGAYSDTGGFPLSMSLCGNNVNVFNAKNDKERQFKMYFNEIKMLTGVSNDVTITDGQITTSNTLSVFGTLNTNVSGYGFLNKTSPTGVYTASGSAPYSIYANSRVLAQEFNAYSDIRHKTLHSYSNGKTDLALLNQLKVSNYTFIDTVGKGTKMQMGFIAQQVEEIVPEAVNKIQDFIPSVYDMAKGIVYDTSAKTLTVLTNKPHDFQEKDEVKLISHDKEHKVKVDKIIDASTFVIRNWENPVDKIFVFGKQVNDFRMVDYDRLFTLGISSIQELSRRVEQLEKENGILKSESKAVKQMKNEIAELRAMIVK